MKTMISSWRTTAAGIAAILAAVASAIPPLVDSDPTTSPEWAVVAAAIMAGVGLIMGRDNGVSSEDAGAK